jgi:hypothetical protein
VADHSWAALRAAGGDFGGEVADGHFLESDELLESAGAA